MPKVIEYVNETGETQGVYAGSEMDGILAADPAWTAAEDEANGDSRETPGEPEGTGSGDGKSKENPDIASLTREKLNEVAVEQGLDPDDYKKKADIVAAITAAQAEPGRE